MWWLEAGKPYPAPYMAQVAVWLSLAGMMQAVGRDGIHLPPPQHP